MVLLIIRIRTAAKILDKGPRDLKLITCHMVAVSFAQ